MNQACYFAIIGFCVLASVTDGTNVQNSIETLVVVDGRAFERWKASFTSGKNNESVRVNQTKAMLTTFINTVFVGVNTIFGSMHLYGIELDARIASIEFTNDSILSDAYNVARSRAKILPNFQGWLYRNNFTAADHAVLLTDRDLSFGITSHYFDTGVTNPSAMCQGLSSVSVVQLVPNGNTVLALTRELEASLGTGDNPPHGCYESLHAKTNAKYAANFRVSQCSRYALRLLLQGLQKNVGGGCLSSTHTTTPGVRGLPMGQQFTPDHICRMTFGRRFYFGRQFYKPEPGVYDQICETIKCAEKGKPLSQLSRVIIGTDGFTCGFKKVCHLGYCWPSANASYPAVTNTCPYGDTPFDVTNVYRHQSCARLMKYSGQGTCRTSPVVAAACCGSCQIPPSQPNPSVCPPRDPGSWCPGASHYSCYWRADNRSCCASCHKYRTHVAGCEFGDKRYYCKSIKCSQCNADAVSNACCGTCKMCETAVPGCKYGDRVSGCEPRLCYTGLYSRGVCCGTCNRHQTGMPGCQYGDRKHYCKHLRYPTDCYVSDKQCCNTCHNHRTSIPGCQYGDRKTWCSRVPLPTRCRLYSATCCGSCRP